MSLTEWVELLSPFGSIRTVGAVRHGSSKFGQHIDGFA